MDAIEIRHDRALRYVVMRQLLATRSPGLGAALLDYLPFADPDVVEEIWYGLEANAAREAKLGPVVSPLDSSRHDAD